MEHGEAAGRRVGQLVVTHPARLCGSVLRLAAGRSVLGRGPGCDLCLDDRYVSAAHAVLSRSGRRPVLEDLDPANGTFVNGRPVHRPRTLRHGDVLTFGTFGTFGHVRAWYDDPGVPVRGVRLVEQTAPFPVADWTREYLVVRRRPSAARGRVRRRVRRPARAPGSDAARGGLLRPRLEGPAPLRFPAVPW